MEKCKLPTASTPAGGSTLAKKNMTVVLSTKIAAAVNKPANQIYPTSGIIVCLSTGHTNMEAKPAQEGRFCVEAWSQPAGRTDA